MWVFVMNVGYSRVRYVELFRRADAAAFIQCHVNAFDYLGGVLRRCLYDKAKVITLGKDEAKRPIWNLRMLDFAMRMGFEAKLCQFYWPQTKGKIENGAKYMRYNMWPSIRFADDADLNGQALEWCNVVANARITELPTGCAQGLFKIEGSVLASQPVIPAKARIQDIQSTTTFWIPAWAG